MNGLIYILKPKLPRISIHNSKQAYNFVGREGEASLPFSENQIQCPGFRKKGHQNVVLTVSRRKTPKFSPAGLFFLNF